jgi:hypothetical protein
MRATPGDLVSLRTGLSTGVTLLLSSFICSMSSSGEEAMVECGACQYGREQDKMSQSFLDRQDVDSICICMVKVRKGK